MMKKNISVWLVLAAMLTVSFSAKAMVEVEAGARSFERPTNSAGVDVPKTDAQKLQEQQEIVRTREAARDAAALRSQGQGNASLLPKAVLESIPENSVVVSRKVNPFNGDLEKIPEVQVLTAAERATLQGQVDQVDFASSSRHVQDLKSVIAQKKDTLARLQGELKELELEQTKVGTNHARITREITKLEARIEILSPKIITPVVQPKKKGLFSNLFGKKDTTVTNGDQASGTTKPTKISWWKNRQHNKITTQVLKDPIVAKAVSGLSDSSNQKALVKSVVVQFKDGKNLSEILDLNSGADEAEKTVIANAYNALVGKIKVTPKIAKVVMDKVKVNLKTMGFDDTQEQSDFAITIIRQLKAGNTPQQIISLAENAFNVAKVGNAVKGEFPETQYTAVVDVILQTLTAKEAITPKAQQKIAAQQGVEIDTLQAKLSKLKEKEESLASEKEAGPLARAELKEQQANVQQELQRAQAEQAVLEQKIAQEALLLKASEKPEQARLSVADQQETEAQAARDLALQRKTMEEARRVALKLQKEETLKAKELAAQLAKAQEAAAAIEAARVEAAKPKGAFGGLKQKIAQEAKDRELAQQARADADLVAQLVAEQKAAQDAAAQAEAEALRLQAQEEARINKAYENIKKRKDDAAEKLRLQELLDQQKATGLFELPIVVTKSNKGPRVKSLLAPQDAQSGTRVSVVEPKKTLILPVKDPKIVTVAEYHEQIVAAEKEALKETPDDALLPKQELVNAQPVGRPIGDAASEDLRVQKFVARLNKNETTQLLLKGMPQARKESIVADIVKNLREGKSSAEIFNDEFRKGTFFKDTSVEVINAEGRTIRVREDDPQLIKNYKELIADIVELMGDPKRNLLPPVKESDPKKYQNFGSLGTKVANDQVEGLPEAINVTADDIAATMRGEKGSGPQPAATTVVTPAKAGVGGWLKKAGDSVSKAAKKAQDKAKKLASQASDVLQQASDALEEKTQ